MSHTSFSFWWDQPFSTMPHQRQVLSSVCVPPHLIRDKCLSRSVCQQTILDWLNLAASVQWNGYLLYGFAKLPPGLPDLVQNWTTVCVELWWADETGSKTDVGLLIEPSSDKIYPNGTNYFWDQKPWEVSIGKVPGCVCNTEPSMYSKHCYTHCQGNMRLIFDCLIVSSQCIAMWK